MIAHGKLIHELIEYKIFWMGWLCFAKCNAPIEPLENCNEWLIKQPAWTAFGFILQQVALGSGRGMEWNGSAQARFVGWFLGGGEFQVAAA